MQITKLHNNILLRPSIRVDTLAEAQTHVANLEGISYSKFDKVVLGGYMIMAYGPAVYMINTRINN